MNEMIERAARAACRQVEQSLATKGDPKPWTALGHATLDSWVDAYWRNYVPEVRAVVEAMREPTGAQTRVAREVSSDHPYRPSAGEGIGLMQAAILWRAMVNEALK